MEEKKTTVDHAENKRAKKVTRIWGWVLIILPAVALFVGAFYSTQEYYADEGVALADVWCQESFADEFLYHLTKGLRSPFLYIFALLGLVMIRLTSLKNVPKAIWVLVYAVAVPVSLFWSLWAIECFQTYFLGLP